MDADEFKDYILGFIFYKYLSERQYALANELLETEEVKDYYEVKDAEDIAAIKDESLERLGYFLAPGETFSAVVAKGQGAAETASQRKNSGSITRSGRLLNQRFGGDAKLLMQTPDHFQREGTFPVQHFINAVSPPDHRFQVFCL